MSKEATFRSIAMPVLRYCRAIIYLLFMLLIIWWTAIQASAQTRNLVPNGDFEAYNDCPGGNSMIAYSPTYTSFPSVKDWVIPSYTTSDYYNACAPEGNPAHVPVNFGGSYRTAHSGNAFAGLYTYLGSLSNPGYTYMEYLTTKLTQPLEKDNIYSVRFYVSTNGNLDFATNIIAVNEIGVHFSTNIPDGGASRSMRLRYDVMNDTNRHLNDPSQWYEIHGLYCAKGGEQWITIGTFNNSDNPPSYTLQRGSVTPNNTLVGYAFVDDVAVTLNQDTACVFFPDAFTPNGDSRNDGFQAVIRCPVRDFKMRIFNRWGESVFTSYNQALVWDGLQGGMPAPLGVYMYFATYTRVSNGKTITTKGDVTLIR